MERTSTFQLTALIILFQIGSTSLFLLASDADRDAWMATLIAMIAGLALLAFVTLPIQHMEPRKNLVEILKSYLGRYVGTALAFTYILYFCYKSVRNVREYGDLMIIYMLPNTPLFAIMLILVLLSGYAVYQGVEVFFRLTEILLPIILLIYITLIIMLTSSELMDLSRLQPMLEKGIKPVVKAAIPGVISFPFGEMVVFLMLWSFYNGERPMSKVSILSYAFSGLFILITNISIISSLGPLSTVSTMPFMLGTSYLQITELIERMDPFVALLLFAGVFVKQTTYFLAAVLTASTLFKVKRRVMILPIGAVIYIGSFLFQSHMAQVWIGFKYNLKYHFPIFQIAIPILLLLIMHMKKHRMRERL
ncbi:spore germination protein KB [Paenibacillus phyllosphaerae]|uniref:Spore germination protein KB n=1 Tax=Paenibacillus phyllosphaerae TaxID=274593 RepID=A0A7W5B357_9BACL|nr:GerAB/ArcD/ProY family transporter [Paenibacillus phyllosphaerae]MBB3113056.1 spore germination protein KB [Paenibacillus phyllosphaerae]